jgi:DNA-directed RNA polymerase specialized sigma24 family protein
MNKELRNILERSLAQLPEKYRIVFIMIEIEDMSIEETTKCLQISKTNVNLRLEKAKELLRIWLTEFYKTDELYDFHMTRCDNIVKNVLNYIETH